MNLFNSKSNSKEEFDNVIKAARQERFKEKENHRNATKIQAFYKRYKVCKRLKEDILIEFDRRIKEEDGEFKFIKATDAFRIFRKFLFFFNPKTDKEHFDKICKYIVSSMFTNESKNSEFKIDYTTVCLEQKLTSCWLNQVKKILCQCLNYLKELRPELSNHQSVMTIYLNILINLTSCSTWTIFQPHQTSINKSQAPAYIQPLLNVMNRFCANVLSYLIKNQFYESISELLMRTMCRNRILINKPALIAALTLSIRPLINNKQDDKYNEEMTILFIKHILSTPALIYHVIAINDSHLNLLNSELLVSCLNVLSNEQHSEPILTELEGNYSLCVLANLVQFCHIHIEFLKTNDQVLNNFIQIVRRVLVKCGRYVVSKQGNLTHWHSILGWFSQSIDQRLHDSLPLVKGQLQLLWNAKLIQLLFKSLLEMDFNDQNKYRNENSDSSNGLNGKSSSLAMYKNLFRKAAYFVSRNNYDTMNASMLNNMNNTMRKLITPELLNICNICSTYVVILKTLSQLRLEILTGICYQEQILINLWKIIWSIGGKNNLNLFVNSLELDLKVESPEFQLLILVCDCSTYLITLLDDKEVYEEQKPFQIQDLTQISSFLNNFIFRVIYIKQIDIEATPEMKYFFNSIHALLILLYRRDSRREFAPKDHWLIKEIKVSNFMKDLESGKKHAELLLKKIPHILPHKERVILFKKYVSKEKELLGLNDMNSASLHSTLVTVHRNRILEDSYQQLNKVQPQVLKSTIRVKFINEQGLSESGIDQNGLGLEFLEETMRKILDPSLNLFAVTTEQRLYPSPSSNIHENHLSLFEFAGKMLGKAVYEGIVIDAPFASFFLNQILPPFHNSSSQTNNQPSLLYSSIDQLPSLDPELYKSLTYIKHYEGDVEDFNLTFSVNENILGELVTYELIPCGKSISVTKENKISYVHLMAHFRMHKQIDEQCNAFVKGFRSIISPEWLAMFSTPELQRLISGDDIQIDLNELRRNTKYYGGFHNNHRVIIWFWDILMNDFTNEELGLLLKFVTSCSKPPLLGFAHLQPSFSIRCVEVGEDLDTNGDTVGSVLRGFLTISNSKNENSFRLPTSSTCFNLLKLPNYQKKSILRDKLRYAIKSNTGFELS